jgi:DNA-directed RNA polymerase subunit N (RpoN/RPB10)
MIYILCPSCGSNLGNIQLAYQRDIKQVLKKYNIDNEELSRNTNNKELIKDKIAILDKYTDKDRQCCRMRLNNFIDIVNLVV